jgi:hypothetical protein
MVAHTVNAMRKVEISRVDLVSLFKLAFLLYAALGLVAGLFYGLVIMMVGQLGNFLGDEDIPGLGYLTGIVGVVAIPVLAIMYGILGSVAVMIGGALYNLAARLVGGVKLDVSAMDSPFDTRTEVHPAPPAG